MIIFEWITRITSETLWREHMRNKNRIKKLEQHINQLQLEVASLHMRVGTATADGAKIKGDIKKLDWSLTQRKEEMAPLHQKVGALDATCYELREMIRADRAAAILLEDISAQEIAAIHRELTAIKTKLESSGIVDNWSIT